MELQLRAAAIVLLLALHSVLIDNAYGERTRDKMYELISGASCFRRLNGTHQTGCSSKESGSVGVLHLINIEADFDFLLNNPPAPPYAPLIPPHLFTRKNILRLKQEGGQNISVILLINRTDKMKQFSQELNCPNQYSGLLRANSTETATCDASKPESSWNPPGTGLLHEDFNFPIYYISDEEEIDKLVQCFEKFNNFGYETHATRSLCAIEVKAFMSAAVNTEVCMRRTNFINNLSSTKFCDPLEGRNVYATLFPRNSPETIVDETEQRQVNAKEKFILITCRIDTTSMFDGVGLGSMDSLLGYATLVNIAHVLHQLLPTASAIPAENQRNVLFVVFNGEAYDYIGSQRLVFDMNHLEFPTLNTGSTPISFENIEFMLDIGTLDNIATIYLHTLTTTSLAQELTTKLNKYANDQRFKFNIDFKSLVGYQIPPTSAQSFLRHNISFPALILNAPPTNKYYHSIYDDVENLKYVYGNTSADYTTLIDVTTANAYFPLDSVQLGVRNVSTVVALALYEMLTGTTYTGTKVANPLLTDEFLYCFLQSADCPLFKAASHPNSLPGLPMPPLRYISVAGATQESSGWTYRLLGYLLSQPQPTIAKENCTNLPLSWFAGYANDGAGECRLTTQNYSHALSPAFLMENYDWKSGEYSSWTESTWSQFSARIFLRPSRIHEVTTLSIGIVVAIISLCVVYIISSRADVLFENAPTSTAAFPVAC